MQSSPEHGAASRRKQHRPAKLDPAIPPSRLPLSPSDKAASPLGTQAPDENSAEDLFDKKSPDIPCKTKISPKNLNESSLAIEIVKEEPKEPVAPIVRKLRCENCLIEFISPTTLNAHQKFYCGRKSSDIASKTESPKDISAANGEKCGNSVGIVSNGMKISVISKSPSPNNRAPNPRVIAPALPIPNVAPATVLPLGLPLGLSLSPGGLRLPIPPASPAQLFPSNSILIPVATHSRPGIEVIGPPQVILPVALPQSGFPSLRSQFPVWLEEGLLNGAQVYPECLADTITSGKTSGFQAPLVKIRSSCEAKPSPITAAESLAAAPSTSKNTQPTPVKLGKRKADSEPLNLSLKDGQNKSSPHAPASKSNRNGVDKNSELPRNHFCPNCGIKFSSAKTLQGHQTYYCQAPDRAIAVSEILNPWKQSPPPERVGSPEIPCSQCSYVAATSNQLSQHIRNSHEAVQGFLCQLCGYIGYSVRGMKSHMKTHLENQPPGVPVRNLEELRNLYVKRISSPETMGSNSETAFPRRAESEHEQSVSPRSTVSKEEIRPADSNESSQSPNRSENGPSAEKSPESSSANPYECRFCLYKSPYKGNVKRHINLVHKSLLSSSEMSESDGS